jgi:hypothetical protein
MGAPTTSTLQSEGLRERNITSTKEDESYSSPPSSDDEGEAEKDSDKNKKTFGRTPDGSG